MGAAYDFAYRPIVASPDEADGGGCDDRPHRVELYAAGANPAQADAPWRPFQVCPEHETQLRRYDERLRAGGVAPRFRPTRPGTAPPGRAR